MFDTDRDRSNQATENEVIAEVKRHSGGVDARTLSDTLVKSGKDLTEVQGAIQRSLDSGRLDLGPKLHLVIGENASEAA